ncbi:MAG: class I SAM-dependent methyltransferase [Candidatus Omnitrophota bacterium]
MEHSEEFEILVSPETGLPLRYINSRLETETGTESFPVHNGIACLASVQNLSEIKRYEMGIFNSIPIQGIPYFRTCLLRDIMKVVKSVIRSLRGDLGKFVVAEMGGGEGYWARFIKEDLRDAIVFVCDLSMDALARAPDHLKKVCADISRPIFKKKSIHLASFWVSLHHLEKADMRNALFEISKVLDDDGVLLIFEPNYAFLPRKIMYRTRLGKDVYFDKHEQAIDFSKINKIAESFNLVEVVTHFMNPPYNYDFIRRLRRGGIYLPVVEALHRIDKCLLSPIVGDMFSAKQSRLKKYFSLYGLSIYRKRKV